MLELMLMAMLGAGESPVFSAQEYGAQTVDKVSVAWLDLPKLPIKKPGKTAPVLISEPFVAVYAQDPASSKVFFAHEIDRPQPIASITKLMTYLVIRENHSLDEVVKVSPEAARIGGASIGLYANEELTVGTLLEAILIPSANDAATALAIWDAGSEKNFVEKMNAKARELGLDSAQFYNASGLDVEGPVDNCDVTQPGCKIETKGNLMSARDVMKLTRILLRDEWFAAVVQLQHFYGTSIDGEFFHEKVTTNRLFGSFVDTKGVKTGYTPLAGQCFVNLAVDEDGNEVLTVVLGSTDRFTETKHIVDWVWDSFEWQ